MSLICYYGGKQKLVSTILPLIPEHKVYVEPFAGGGAVFFNKAPSPVEIINDNDAMISIFYRVLINDFEALKKKVEETLYCRASYTVAQCIRRQPHLFNELQIAWAFYHLTNAGFSGSITSFGCYTKGKTAQTYQNKKALFTSALKHRLEGVQVECTDAVKLIKLRDTKDTFFYIDPPYIGTNQSHYKGYTLDDYKTLLDTLKDIKGKFLLSSFPSQVLDEYIRENGWHSKSINQSKCASRNTDGTRKRKIEVLTANYPI